MIEEAMTKTHVTKRGTVQRKHGMERYNKRWVKVEGEKQAHVTKRGMVEGKHGMKRYNKRLGSRWKGKNKAALRILGKGED